MADSQNCCHTPRLAENRFVFELEAIQPDKLQELLRDAIDRVIDKPAFNAELDAEKSDAAFLAGVRGRVHSALGDCLTESEEE